MISTSQNYLIVYHKNIHFVLKIRGNIIKKMFSFIKTTIFANIIFILSNSYIKKIFNLMYLISYLWCESFSARYIVYVTIFIYQ